jgi:hypothetical protein
MTSPAIVGALKVPVGQVVSALDQLERFGLVRLSRDGDALTVQAV